MDFTLPAKYKEVPLFKQNIIKNKRKRIDVTCGGFHTMSLDSKTSELSGSFIFDESREECQHATRFVHWRTSRETIYLSEICLYRNDVCHSVKITFKGSPILSVDVPRQMNSVVFILITTTTSFHRIPLRRPTDTDHHLQIEQDSILLKLDENIITDPLNCYTFINDIGQSLPVTGAAMHCNNGSYSKFAVATSNSLYLFTMLSGGEKPGVKFLELEQTSLSLSKFIHHIADSWRRKTHTSQVVTMCFSTPAVTENQSLLYTLHRDGVLRVWLLCGRFLAAEYMSKYTQGSEAEFHSCVLRRSTSLLGLFFSFTTFSEFVILRPILFLDENIGTISSLVLQNVCTILSPNYDLIDFKLCDQSIWSLWSNSQGEMQTLAYDLTTKDGFERNGWLPVVMENITENYGLGLDSSSDLRDVYCNRIFHSGYFPDKVIRKTLTMFNRNLADIAGSTATGSMVRLKRYVLACIESQLQQEEAIMRQNGPLDDEQLIEISNGLWEKFYLYCTQYKYESSRPVGLFLIEKQMNESSSITAGIVRKKFITFFRTCDWVEVAFYSPISNRRIVCTESHETDRAIDMVRETQLLVECLSEIEQILTQEQKHELNSYVHQRQESGTVGDDLLLISASQNHYLIHNVMPAFLQRMSDLTGAIGGLLEWLKPADRCHSLSTFLWQQKDDHHVSVYTSDGLACELVLVTAKQTIQLRYVLLRNLLLLQNIIKQHCNLPYDIIDSIQSNFRPDTETLLRCYHVMNWIAQTRLDLDWTRTTKIAASFPINLRTSMTLLQAYATHQLNNNLSCWLESSAGSSINSTLTLSLMTKANILVTYLSPSTDDFLFGEWLSDNDLHVYIDEYVRLLGDWCEWNCCSRNFIRSKSYLMLGDTSKALDLFPLSLKGIQSERFLQKFLRQNDQHAMSPYEILSAFFLRLIQLFEFYGAYDGVLTLVHTAVDNTIQQKQQAMFQSIEFSSHIELGHYEEAYNTLTKNCDLARKKDCLRQLICLLFSVRRLDVLMSLPCYGLEAEFTNIVAMNARSADVVDSVQYDFLYSFYINKMNLRKAAITSYEEAMRNYVECISYDHLNRYYRSLLKCLNSLAINKPTNAWILRPVMENKIGQIITTSCTNGDEIDIVDMKDLHEQLMTTYCALQLSQIDGCLRLVTSLESTEIIALLLSKQMYHLALKLAHLRVRSMVPTIYEHITSACLVAFNKLSCDTYDPTTNSAASHSLSWLNGNCISDITVGTNIASTAWNYLRYMIDQEKVEAVNAHLAVLNRVITRGAQVPSWLKAWCFEHAPVKLIRSYMSHGRLEEAYECTVELFKARFFSAGRFSHQTLFPLTVCEHLFYELCQTSKYSKEKEHIEQYLRIVEVAY